eukprot:GHRR01023246.1.p2 GENE.GHRR01023246.1~~GHRR01023246.1.p2  ORF type:complete len:131 (+),score=31.42 GHRR01023246.1:71-463(+)
MRGTAPGVNHQQCMMAAVSISAGDAKTLPCVHSNRLLGLLAHTCGGKEATCLKPGQACLLWDYACQAQDLRGKGTSSSQHGPSPMNKLCIAKPVQVHDLVLAWLASLPRVSKPQGVPTIITRQTAIKVLD